MADLIVEDTSAVLRESTLQTIELLQQTFTQKEQIAITQLRSEGVQDQDITLIRLVDARYLGQSFELTIPFTEDLEDNFHNAHHERYGYRFPERSIEIVNLRLQAIGRTKKPIRDPEPVGNTDSSSALLGEKSALARDQELITFSLYERDQLHPGAILSGAALVFQMDSTTYIPPSWEARVDPYRNLILEYKK
jgi:N-methylhydantoinase A